MEVRIIAEGPADKHIVKAIVRAISDVEPENIIGISPSDFVDDTDKFSGNFSDWYIVLEKIADAEFLESVFSCIDDDFVLVVQIDTAERGLKNYDVLEPLRTGNMDWTQYAEEVRENVKQKMQSLLPVQYHGRVAYAIAVEETEAWIVPLFENTKYDSACHVNVKERLQRIIGKNSKAKRDFVDTNKGDLNYLKLGKSLAKGLVKCRTANRSLDLFCVELEALL